MICPHCNWKHASDDTYAVNRFNPEVSTRYRANYPGAPLVNTRDDAVTDMCEWRAGNAKHTHVTYTEGVQIKTDPAGNRALTKTTVEESRWL